MPGMNMAIAQVVQSMWKRVPITSLMALTTSGLGAVAVMNIPEVMGLELKFTSAR